MADKPNRMDIDGDFSESPSSVLVRNTTKTDKMDAGIQPSVSQSPSKMLFDDDDAVPESIMKEIDSDGLSTKKPQEIKVYQPKETDAKSKMVSRMLTQLKDSGTQFRAAPDVSDIVLNEDSSINTQQTLNSPYIINTISAELNNTFNELATLARMEDGLKNYADAENAQDERVQVQFNIMVGNIVLRNVSCYSGDKIVLPTQEEISAEMGSEWNPELFVGWDSDGIARDNTDVHAILKSSFRVEIRMSGNLLDTISVPEGSKVAKIVEINMKQLNLVPPLFTNYSVYCKTRVISADTVINLEPKNQQAAAAPLGQKPLVVIFAIKPSYLGINVSSMTKEELKEAAIISKTTVSYGNPVNPPTDEQLLEHGMSLPFDKYYKWSADLSSITSNIVIKAIPHSVVTTSSNIIETAKSLTADDLMAGGIALAKNAMNALANPVMVFKEKRLVRTFENGRPVRTRDFVFLKHGAELMLYRYTGASLSAEVPVSVNGMYVRYIHPQAFSSGPISLKNLFGKNRNAFSIGSMSSGYTNVNQVMLPNSIRFIPSKFLYKVSGVSTVVIPASVTEISLDAFSGSSIEEIYFDGGCPRGFDRENVKADIFVRKQNYKSFFG